jgi:shikimate kinase
MNEKAKNIVLTGFRATGKSLVGKMLAERLGYAFIDADNVLCERLGGSIANIVARHGWASFRQAERALLAEVPAMVRTVLATGGGAIEHQEQWQRLSDCCYIVWLEADAATLRQRMGDDPNSAGQRPSLTGRPIQDEIAELLQKREPLYSAGSDLRLDTAAHGPAALVDRIISALRSDLGVSDEDGAFRAVECRGTDSPKNP